MSDICKKRKLPELLCPAGSPAALDAALTRAFATEGPYIIDCKIDKDEFVLPMLPPGGSMDDIITKLEVEL